MTRQDIAAVLEQIPQLHNWGVGLMDNWQRLPQDERRATIKQAQEELLGSAEDCTRICQWLGSLSKIESINERHSSYGLKHMVEQDRDIDYVTNGAFIAAAIHAGFKYKLAPHSPNVMFNISEKSLKAKMTQRSQLVL